MKQLYLIYDPDDYFARDALLGEMAHHGLHVSSCSSVQHADGAVLIIGSNIKLSDAIQSQIDSVQKHDKPMLTITSHPEARNVKTFASFSPQPWGWQIIEEFIEGL